MKIKSKDVYTQDASESVERNAWQYVRTTTSRNGRFELSYLGKPTSRPPKSIVRHIHK